MIIEWAAPSQASAPTSDAGQPSIPPEDVIARSGLDASTVTSFLFENYPDFIRDDAIEDAASAAANFSDAMHMIRRQMDSGGALPCTSPPVLHVGLGWSLASQRSLQTCSTGRMPMILVLRADLLPLSPAGGQWIDPDFSTKSAADAAASCSACRGYMWANQHPAQKGFRPIRAPVAFAAARATAHNRAELVERVTNGLAELQPATQVSVQTVPYARVVAAGYPAHPVRGLLPLRWQKLWRGAVQEEYGGGTQVVPASADVEAAELGDDIED
jgi:hypothetical protein